ncbi:MAG: ThiF family adenylyltransferase [Cyanobacteria bacterium REEB65]|nr:ThiF family adenylyltransferase [Cyanobacteria bacterium REEB65]
MSQANPLGRYARQVLLPFLAAAGQEKLRAGRVVLIGCGALGTGIANNLVRAGVGFLRICDRDFVELHNLSRQILFDEGDVAEQLPKAEAAARHLVRANSEVVVEPRSVDVNYTNVEELLAGADVVLDGTDNFQTRYLLNDACSKANIPWVYGACVASHGMVMPILPGRTACLRCAFPEPAPPAMAQTCDTAGVLNAAAQAVACIQSAEAIKLLLGAEDALVPGLLEVDLWEPRYTTLKVPRQPDCLSCGPNPRWEYLDGDRAALLTSLCGRNAVQVVQRETSCIELATLAEALSPLGTVSVTKFLLSAKIDPYEITLFPDGRAIIKGTDDLAIAQSVYAKYIGI